MRFSLSRLETQNWMLLILLQVEGSWIENGIAIELVSVGRSSKRRGPNSAYLHEKFNECWFSVTTLSRIRTSKRRRESSERVDHQSSTPFVSGICQRRPFRNITNAAGQNSWEWRPEVHLEMHRKTQISRGLVYSWWAYVIRKIFPVMCEVHWARFEKKHLGLLLEIFLDMTRMFGPSFLDSRAAGITERQLSIVGFTLKTCH